MPRGQGAPPDHGSALSNGVQTGFLQEPHAAQVRRRQVGHEHLLSVRGADVLAQLEGHHPGERVSSGEVRRHLALRDAQVARHRQLQRLAAWAARTLQVQENAHTRTENK